LYEAFKLVADLPGSVVELGVFKGESLLFFAKLMEIFNVNDRSCAAIGFDNFHGFEPLHEKDGKPIEAVGKVQGGWSSAAHYEELKTLINLFDHDRLVPQKPRIRLVEGDICKTVPQYVADNPGLRIRLLNIDCDMYEPTLAGLKHLYDLVVPGGVVLIDEYGFSEFPGESRAVEEFFGDRMPVIRKFLLNSNPGGYLIKQ
ncbi:MAG: TylF/MycF/NovP-related O-methyltransferase, partial [Terriglobia bacterium]